MKSTKELASELGLLRKRSTTHADSDTIKKQRSVQVNIRWPLKILIMRCYSAQISPVEFPAVLLNTRTGVLESEFQHYVQPSEHTRLSTFCTQLTGITQEQVDEGIPIGVCLRLFLEWLQELKQQKDLAFPYEFSSSFQGIVSNKNPQWCTIVTWSDWDLNVCLRYECRRKQLRHPPELKSWIDLRAVYRKFYSRKPQGLAGALQDLGIKFAGRQHSGIDDARNTAKLTWRLISDGCILSITGAIDRKPTDLMSVAETYKQITTNTTSDAKDTSVNKSSNQDIGQHNTTMVKTLDHAQPHNPATSNKTNCSTSKTTKQQTTAVQNKTPNRVQPNYPATSNKTNCNIPKNTEQQNNAVFKTPNRVQPNNPATSNKTLNGSSNEKKDCKNNAKYGADRPALTPSAIINKTAHNNSTSDNFTMSTSETRSLEQPPENKQVKYDATVKPPNKRSDQIDESDESLCTANIQSTRNHDSHRVNHQADSTSKIKSIINLHTSVCSPVLMSTMVTAVSGTRSLVTPFTSMTSLEQRSPLEQAASLLQRKCTTYSNCESNTVKVQGNGLQYQKGIERNHCYKPTSGSTVRNSSNNRLYSPKDLISPICTNISDNLPNGTVSEVIKTCEVGSKVSTTFKGHVQPTVTPNIAGMNKSKSCQSKLEGSIHLGDLTKSTFLPRNTARTIKASFDKTPKPNPITPIATTPLISFNGGKITPPFCGCGRRACRRTVLNPGPNQGRVFYVCTGNKTKPRLGTSRCQTGCGYFKWEIEAAMKRGATPLTTHSGNKRVQPRTVISPF